MSYFANLKQDVQVDLNNSSNAVLLAAGSFVGTATSTLGVVGLQVSLKTDQNCTVYVEQSPGLGTGTGTVTTNGTDTLAGSGTNFLSRKIGDQIYVSGETVRIIKNIVSDISLTATSAFSTTAGSLSYQMYDWDISDAYDYRNQNYPNFGITVQAVNSYVRIRVTNVNATSPTSYFRLQLCLCPIVEALPRSLNGKGLLKISIQEISDTDGNIVKISPNGALSATKVVRLIGASFSGTTIDASFWGLTTSANGYGAQTGGQYELRTITPPSTSSPNGAAALQSTRTARYINGVPNYIRAQVDSGGAPPANNTKRFGAFTGTAGSPTDGCMIEVINQIGSIATYKGGVPNRITNGSFNGDYGLTLNDPPVGVQTYEIAFNNRYVYFYYNNILLHKIDASTDTWTNALSLPLRAENYNTGNSQTDTSLKIRSFVVMRYGEPNSRPQWKNTHGVLSAANGILKRGPGTLHSVVNNDNLGTLAVYDALSAANPIATLDLTKIFGQLRYDIDFYTGLTIVQTDAGADTTVVFE